MAIHGFIYQGVQYVAQGAGGAVGAVASAGVEALMSRTLGRQTSTAGSGLGIAAPGTSFPTFPEGADIKVLSQEEAKAMGIKVRCRRRRRKLLTCGDKADIAFLHGNLGGGQLGRSAISAVLARRCS